MAKTYEILKREFDAIHKEFEAFDEDTDTGSKTRGHHDGMVEQGTGLIGDRVRELREAGTPGATLDAFKNDPEVKTALAEIDVHLAAIDKEQARTRALSAGAWRKTLLRYKQFKAMRDYLTETPSYKLPNYYRKHRDSWLTTELAKSKGKALSEAQAELFERLLVDRNFNKYSSRVKVLFDGVLKSVTDGKAALAARNASGLTSAQADGSKQLKALDDLVAQYIQARAQIGDAAILNGKGGDKTIAGIQTMITRRDKARVDFDPISKAKITG